MSKKKGYTQDDYVAAYAAYGSTRKAAEALGVVHSVVDRALQRAGQQPSKVALYGTAGGATKTKRRAAPRTAKEVKRYIVTAAQSQTKVNQLVWDNLLALADYYDAELMVSPFAYNTHAFGHQRNAKPGKAASAAEIASDMDAQLVPYLVRDRVQLAPGLLFCAEVQILPTAADPLSGMEAYTGRKSGIFPHAKIEMRSVPSMRDEPTKFNYTTGAVTQHNYIQKKAGQKGEFHHAYGALIVEVTKDGWWVRQLNADKTGAIYDLDIVADGGEVYESEGAEALVVGDVHVACADPEVISATWDELIPLLKPKTQILHDLFDMRSRPWQDERSFSRQYEKFIEGQDSVQEELHEAAGFLNEAARATTNTVVVWSNHHDKLDRWLDDRSYDFKADLVNADFYLRAQYAVVRAVLDKEKDFILFKWAMKDAGDESNARYLRLDESYILCPDASGGIECGLHGDRGPNGAKGTPTGFKKMARRMIIGDKHTAGIYGGVYVVGTCAPAKNTGYARGPSSWSPTHCVVYPNGKRALVACWKGRFFAPRD